MSAFGATAGAIAARSTLLFALLLAACTSTSIRNDESVVAADAAPSAAAAAAIPQGSTAPAGMSGATAAVLNLSLSSDDKDAMRVLQTAAPETPPQAEPEPPDRVLERRVRVLIGADPAYANAAVTVRADGSRVTLSGDVVSRAQGDSLRRDVSFIPGVLGVDAQLRVRDN